MLILLTIVMSQHKALDLPTPDSVKTLQLNNRNTIIEPQLAQLRRKFDIWTNPGDRIQQVLYNELDMNKIDYMSALRNQSIVILMGTYHYVDAVDEFIKEVNNSQSWSAERITYKYKDWLSVFRQLKELPSEDYSAGLPAIKIVPNPKKVMPTQVLQTWKIKLQEMMDQDIAKLSELLRAKMAVLPPVNQTVNFHPVTTFKLYANEIASLDLFFDSLNSFIAQVNTETQWKATTQDIKGVPQGLTKATLTGLELTLTAVS